MLSAEALPVLVIAPAQADVTWASKQNWSDVPWAAELTVHWIWLPVCTPLQKVPATGTRPTGKGSRTTKLLLPTMAAAI
jgi:hypothetical protein